MARLTYLEYEGKGKGIHDLEGSVGGVGVAQLKDLDKDHDHQDIHEGRVELQADVGRTQVEDHATSTLKIKSRPQHPRLINMTQMRRQENDVINFVDPDSATLWIRICIPNTDDPLNRTERGRR